MLFNSYIFIFAYLPVVFFGFFSIAKKSHRLAALWLALASIFFYGWWNPKFVLLLALSIVFNFLAGHLIDKVRCKKLILFICIALNISLLIFYKYFNFFLSTANNLGGNFELLDIVLPLGISFFTFTQIAYLVDVYQGKVREYHFVHYLLFVTWFPHLIAGPVLHHQQMMPQFSDHHSYSPNLESIKIGLCFFSLGLFKKVVLADEFAIFANPLFDSNNITHPMLLSSWIGAIAYTLQLYFDFSAYSDMAVGLSRLFNIRLPINFDSPYKASNIIDFWRRWHITLSQFLRDYLYYPLGGNKKGIKRRYINLFSVMLLGGLWHGSGWNFVLWGGLHGVYLIVNHLWRHLFDNHLKVKSRFYRYFSTFLTFTVVVIAWVPFRSISIAETVDIWKGMMGLNGISTALQDIFPGTGVSAQESFRWLILGLIIIFAFPNTQQIVEKYQKLEAAISNQGLMKVKRLNVFWGIAMGLIFAFSVLLFKKNSPFIYFQF